jgi:hypothetical protein
MSETNMQTLLQRIHAEQLQVGEATQPPASKDQIDQLRADLSTTFQASLPNDYADFLLLASGLAYNGLVLYGVTQSRENPGKGGFWQGMISANSAWRLTPGLNDILVLGDTDIDLFTVNLDGSSPCMRDKVGGDVVDVFFTVAEAIEIILQKYL